MPDITTKMHRTLQYLLAARYTARYQDIVSRIPPDVLYQREKMSAKHWKSEPGLGSVIHAYIDLCAEELRLHRSKEIPDEVWQNWEQGIRAGMRLPAIAGMWEEFFKTGPYDELREFLSAEPERPRN